MVREMGKINFAKMVASGNDFIVIDNRSLPLSESGHSLNEIARTLCERKISIGADGMLLIEKSVKADLKMRVFNPDGSEVDMCGNVFCTGPGGIWVLSEGSDFLGVIKVPEVPANLAWGDSDLKSLYITARTGLYRTRVRTGGTPLRAR